MLALTTGRDLLAGLAGTFLHEAAITALDKIRDAVPAELAARATAATNVIIADRRPARDYAGRSAVVRSIADAIHRRETVALTYQKLAAARAEQRIVDPYHLHVHAGAIYVLGYCHRRKDMKTFLLDRSAAARAVGSKFERRAEIDVSEVLQGELDPWKGRAEHVRPHFSPWCRAWWPNERSTLLKCPVASGSIAGRGDPRPRDSSVRAVVARLGQRSDDSRARRPPPTDRRYASRRGAVICDIENNSWYCPPTCHIRGV